MMHMKTGGESAAEQRTVRRSSFEEQLAQHGRLIYTNCGDSMMPLIRQDRDLLIIEPVHGRLKRFDVPLYRRDSGQYVLHRILKVRAKDYVICGDNRWQKEYGITDRHIIGVLTGIVRDGRTVSVTDPRYRLYVAVWCGLFPVRALALRVIRKLSRMWRNRR